MTTTGTVDPRSVVPRGIYERTLRTVNAIRAKCGRKPLKALPRGVPEDPRACPIYFALNRDGISADQGVDGPEVHLSVQSKCKNPFTGGHETHEGDSTELANCAVFESFIKAFDRDVSD